MGISKVTDLSFGEMQFITGLMKDICSGRRQVSVPVKNAIEFLELSGVQSSMIYESICNSLTNIMNNPVWTGNTYSPLFDEWKVDREFINLTINKDVVNNQDYSIDYITKILCNPNKQSFLVKANELE